MLDTSVAGQHVHCLAFVPEPWIRQSQNHSLWCALPPGHHEIRSISIAAHRLRLTDILHHTFWAKLPWQPTLILEKPKKEQVVLGRLHSVVQPDLVTSPPPVASNLDRDDKLCPLSAIAMPLRRCRQCLLNATCSRMCAALSFKMIPSSTFFSLSLSPFQHSPAGRTAGPPPHSVGVISTFRFTVAFV